MKINPELEVKTAIEIQKEQEKQLKLKDKIIPHNNHTLFEIKEVDGEIKIEEAEYEMGVAQVVNGKLEISNKKVIEKSGCIYISALNKKSALKKYKKGQNGTRYDNSKSIEIKPL